MAFTVEQFVESLAASGLMTRDEIGAVRRRITSHTTIADGVLLAREFVRLGKLTDYQAGVLCSARSQRLVVGDYVVLDALGSGSMGHVFKAEHRRMRRVVALKLLTAAAALSPQARERFLREARALARLEHPNIVAAYDASECGGTHYLVMQYVDGCDLEYHVRERGRLPIDRALDCVLQTAAALEYAHGQGVIHRDVKPSNLLLDRAGAIKVLDLGLALIEENVGATTRNISGRLTQPGQALGTADFIAPEQADDTRDADHRSDIYSLGCTLYYLLLGESPYQRETVTQTLLAHREAPIPSLCSGRIAGATPELDAVFARMLAKEPGDRFPSMSEVIAALRKCGVPLPARQPSSPATEPWAGGGPSTRPSGTISESSSPTDGRLERASPTESYARGSTRDMGQHAGEASKSADWGSHQLSDWSLDREVAQWVLLIGGSVVVCRQEQRVAVKHIDYLPKGSFLLETIGLEYNRLVTDSDLARFRGLKELRRLYLHGTDVTDEGLHHLVGLASLTDLSLGKSRITDAALPCLARMKTLKHLSLRGTAVSDGGLPHLATLEGLESLNLVGSRASAEGVSALHATLPRCRIASV